MKTFLAALLIVSGFALWGTESETLTVTVRICLLKIALISGGGYLLIHDAESGDI